MCKAFVAKSRRASPGNGKSGRVLEGSTERFHEEMGEDKRSYDSVNCKWKIGFVLRLVNFVRLIKMSPEDSTKVHTLRESINDEAADSRGCRSIKSVLQHQLARDRAKDERSLFGCIVQKLQFRGRNPPLSIYELKSVNENWEERKRQEPRELERLRIGTTLFHKQNSTICDYFVAIKGEWALNAKRGLVEVPLGGCSLTRVHKSATKMRDANSDLLNTRMNVVKSLQDLDKLDSLEVAQKAKIKWSIKGDENSKYFHGSSPIYYMPMFKVLMQVLKKNGVYSKTFFNRVEDNEKKMSWARWKSVLASKEKGGLGVSSFYALNRALLFKWVWRFRNDNRSLWARVIQAVHGEDGSLSNSPKSSRASIWLDIVRDLTHIKKQGIDLLGLIKKKVGNGEDTLFWEDVWKDNVAFKLLYPRVYELESFKKITVAAKLAHDHLGYSSGVVYFFRFYVGRKSGG
ncbi:hypothetical protein Tco_1019734 [Tanacetum coccineum]|uniref:RNA-directed DNA polymerase, eukaryota, reverse transcriptase zinc-binding domain protein n=1 Tax=Tanacetum coccineum TaxID=301880 RepID=A0ABQ5FZN6_9ASTR